VSVVTAYLSLTMADHCFLLSSSGTISVAFDAHPSCLESRNPMKMVRSSFLLISWCDYRHLQRTSTDIDFTCRALVRRLNGSRGEEQSVCRERTSTSHCTNPMPRIQDGHQEGKVTNIKRVSGSRPTKKSTREVRWRL
jgi:hypothetical protein